MKSIFSILCLLLVLQGLGQDGRQNPLPPVGTLVTPIPKPAIKVQKPAHTDSLPARKPTRKLVTKPGYEVVVRLNPYYNSFGKPVSQSYSRRAELSKDALFYMLLGIVFYFALVRLLFLKYMENFFTLIFRASLKQKQIREQLLQTPLPSLLLNLLFLINGGIYISFLLHAYHFVEDIPMFALAFYASLALGVIYLFKFIMLKFLGWIFNIAEATDMYIFIVFLVNKLLGILLIPFIILIAFSTVPDIFLTLSICMVIFCFLYRYVISFGPIRKQINVSQLHFFLYLCGFEVIPLLVIYKVLLNFLERSI